MKNKIKVAVIGCGHLGSTVISCMTNPSTVSALKSSGSVFVITAADRDESKLIPIREVVSVTVDNALAVRNSDYVLLAVKPSDVASAVSGLELSEKVIISFVAGLKISTLEQLTGSRRIVRAMPNINARVGEAFTAYAETPFDGEAHDDVLSIFGSLGVFSKVDERLMNAATGVTGSAPAFVFEFIKALSDEAAALGFSNEDAKRMAVQTVIGSALTAETSELSSLINEVCSSGGTTERGMAYLSEHGFSGAVRGAVRAAASRAEEIEQ